MAPFATFKTCFCKEKKPFGDILIWKFAICSHSGTGIHRPRARNTNPSQMQVFVTTFVAFESSAKDLIFYMEDLVR